MLSDDPHLTVRHLRPAVEPKPELFDLQLNWSAAEFAATATACHGCGACRTQEPSLRMCPFFRAESSEDRTPRAKANAIRAVVDGRIPAHELASPDMGRLAKKCFNCKQCQLECVNHVDVPHLMIEAKAQHLATHGPATADWFLSRVHLWGEWLCRLSWLVNPLLGGSGSRWLLERVVGVARERRLPPFARRSFLSSIPREWTAPPVTIRAGQPVVYFVDHFANYHDPELGFAFAKILQHNGQTLHVPPKQVPSGTASGSPRPMVKRNGTLDGLLGLGSTPSVNMSSCRSGASAASASSRVSTWGSTSYSTSISASAASAMTELVAATAATACPS